MAGLPRKKSNGKFCSCVSLSYYILQEMQIWEDSDMVIQLLPSPFRSLRAPDKREYLMKIRDNFSDFSMKPYVVTPYLNRLVETFQMRVTTYVFNQK